MTTATTDDTGLYRIANVFPGKGLLVAEVTLAQGIKVNKIQTVLVEELQVTEVDFQFSPASAGLKGQLNVQGHKVAQWKLRLSISGEDGTEQKLHKILMADAGGATSYSFPQVPPGHAELYAAAIMEDGTNYSGQASFELLSGNETLQDIDIALGTVIAGTVALPEKHQEVILGVLLGEVQIPEFSMEALMSIEAKTAAMISVGKDGTYHVDGLSAGMHTVLVLVHQEHTDSARNAETDMLTQTLFDVQTVEAIAGETVVLDLNPTY
jgi:hypothetical protein